MSRSTICTPLFDARAELDAILPEIEAALDRCDAARSTVRMTAADVPMNSPSPYYSQRLQQRTSKPDPTLGVEFIRAFLAYIDRLTATEYLCESFGTEICDGYPGGRDDERISARVVEEFGSSLWPAGLGIESDALLDLIEFFFRHVSKPTKWWHHDFCRNSHPSGTYDSMFERFNHPYKLRKGTIVHVSSAVLDSRIYSTEFETADSHLLMLLTKAVEFYSDRSGRRKLDALRCVVDAFERLKTLESGDKKRSIEQVLARISPTSEIRETMNTHFTNLTTLANRSTIRHHERDRAVLEDSEFIDYLFHTYYNVCRLVLGKYGAVRKTGSQP
jgi:hypothetical protein